MNNPLDSQDFVAGALAAVTGNIEIKEVAGCNTGMCAWYRVYDTISEECRAVLAMDHGEPICEPCDPNDKTEFTRAFIKTLRFGESAAEPHLWFSALEGGWVDSEWIDLQILRPILERGAVELGTDFSFDVWAVEGVRGKKPKTGRRK